MDTIKVNPRHLSDINTKEIIFGGGLNDYGVVQTGVDQVICIAPYAMRLSSLTIRADTIETADGTVDLKKAASATALSSGTKMVTTLVPTTAGGLVAATNYAMALVATAADYEVAAGDMVVLMIGSTGDLTGLAYTAVFERV